MFREGFGICGGSDACARIGGATDFRAGREERLGVVAGGLRKKTAHAELKLIKYASSNPADSSGHPNIRHHPGGPGPLPAILDPAISDNAMLRGWRF
jgi:hypothetical protein